MGEVMTNKVDQSKEFVSASEWSNHPDKWALVDVRSPGEFACGHVPGTVNIPLFSNEERARVGIAYKMLGHEEAVLLGLEIVGPRMRQMAEQMKECAGDRTLLLYCWRGGMRSESMLWLAQRVGLSARLMSGGYKGFRRWALDVFAEKRHIAILSASSGCGKTERLETLAQSGEAVVDLEGLAVHRGSAFGGLALPPQPSQQTFENALALELARVRRAPVIWMECESRLIGRLRLPDDLWRQMKVASTFHYEVPMELRIARLVKEYKGAGIKALKEAVLGITKRLGHLRVQEALSLLDREEYEECCELLLRHYYDPFYLRGLGRRPPACVVSVPYDVSPTLFVERLQQAVRQRLCVTDSSPSSPTQPHILL